MAEMFVVSKIIPIFVAMKIKEIWFDAEHIYGRDEEEREYSQSLLWYPKLRTATDEERAAYTFGFNGIHWRGLDEDVSLSEAKNFAKRN